MQLFAPKSYDGTPIHLPKSSKRSVRWLPQIGDIFPNFQIASTDGPIEFWSWAEGSWILLFSHPEAKTPVCTTELGELASNQAEFKATGAKVLGLSPSPINVQQEWHSDIEAIYNAKVWFPTASDPNGELASLFGMKHRHEHPDAPIRKSFILDPQLRIRVIFEYPVCVGRSVEETIRVIQALKMHDDTGFAIPSDWYEGDPLVVPSELADADVMTLVGSPPVIVLPYLRMAFGKERKGAAG